MKPQTIPPDLTVKETCEVLRVTAPTVYNMLRQGRLESYMVGRARRITHESVQRLRQGKS